jgi:hypothetical protein
MELEPMLTEPMEHSSPPVSGIRPACFRRSSTLHHSIIELPAVLRRDDELNQVCKNEAVELTVNQ